MPEELTQDKTEFPISPQEIGHVVLRVRDIARSTAFYELLGFSKVAEIPRDDGVLQRDRSQPS